MKTVKVRIAVAVDPEGECAVTMIDDGVPWREANWLLKGLEPGAARYFMSAELPVPEAQEIAATVEEAKP